MVYPFVFLRLFIKKDIMNNKTNSKEKKNKLIKAIIPVSIILILAILTILFKYNSMTMEHNMGDDMHANMQNNNKTENKNIPFEWYSEGMKEHCEMMPEMKGCEKYVELKENNKWEEKWWHMWHNMWWNSWEQFDIEGADLHSLPEVKKSEIIELKNWDTYKMVASVVKQEVWNRIVKRLAYNWMIPWPILKVEKGSKINLKFTNNLDIETTLHSHWLRLDDSKFDGLPTTMWGEQKPMKPWESFTYELNFDDTWLYWYHPHMREDYTQEMGLYGNFSVSEEDYWNPNYREEFMILDDFSLDDPFYKDKVNKTLMWRFGDIMMINNDENYEIEARTWEGIRMFVTNVANTRTFDFNILFNKCLDNVKCELQRFNQNFRIVWWDIWRIEKEKYTTNQIIAPAERYIVETIFTVPWIYEIQSKWKKLWSIVVTWDFMELEMPQLRENTSGYKNIRDNFQSYLDKKIDKKLELTISMQWMKWWMMMWEWEQHDDDGIEWEDTMAPMNKMSNDKMMEWKLIDKDTWKENMEIEWNFKKWDFVKVEIFNDPKSMHPMQHPIHFHGQRFVVLTRDWKPNDNLQWKDTTLVRNWEKIEILIEMTNPWTWMSHCHIAEHLQSGMMLTFKVEE